MVQNKQAQICAEGCEGENFTQILCKYCTNTVQIIYKLCANIQQIMQKCYTNIVQIHLNIFYILHKYCEI